MRPHRLASILAVLAACALAACGQASSSTSSQTPTSTVVHTSATVPVAHAARTKTARHPAHRPAPAKHASAAGGLPVSSASGGVVQSQPAPGSCHAKGSGPYSEPDPRCTPGALNPAVTQATIGQTICMSGWTSTVRPSTSVTDPEKLASMAAYGDGGSPGDYEYDHLASLELGGAVNDRRNLWPEPEGSPNPKDGVENALHRMVCDGEMSLAEAQHIIATEWVSWANSHGYGGGPGRQTTRSAATRSATTPSTAPSGGPNKPISEVNCSDFAAHAAAQQWFEQHGGSATNDVAGLDRNHDGIACSSLP